MVSQTAGGSEFLVALLTRVGLLPQMSLLMRLEVVDVCKPLATRVTHQRFLVGMNRDVFRERALQCKALTTDIALERTQTSVMTAVLLQLTVEPIRLSAHRTIKRNCRFAWLSSRHHWC